MIPDLIGNMTVVNTPVSLTGLMDVHARSHSAYDAADALSKAFPMLHHEHAQHHKARMGAFQSCWSGLSAHVKVRRRQSFLLHVRVLQGLL